MSSDGEKQRRAFRRFSDFREAYIVNALEKMTTDELIDLMGRCYEMWSWLEERYADDIAEAWRSGAFADE